MSTDLPTDITTEAVLDLYAQFLEADRDGASSNDVVQILDDWFVANGFPTVIYRTIPGSFLPGPPRPCRSAAGHPSTRRSTA